MTACEYINSIDFPVLFMVHAGAPAGATIALLEDTVIGNPDDHGRDSWLDLEGTVQEDGSWEWDGHGVFTVYRGNPVRRCKIYQDQKFWEKANQEWLALE